MQHKAWRSIKEKFYCFSRSFIKFQGYMRQSYQIEHSQIPVWIHRWLWNDAHSLKWCRRGALLLFFFRSSFKFQGHNGWKIDNLTLNSAFPDENSTFNWLMVMKWHTYPLGAWRSWPVRCYMSNFKVIWAEKLMIWFQFEHFQMMVPIWNHKWLWNDPHSF